MCYVLNGKYTITVDDGGAVRTFSNVNKISLADDGSAILFGKDGATMIETRNIILLKREGEDAATEM